MEQIMSTISFSAICPEIIIVSFSLMILVLQSVSSTRFRGYYGYISLIGVVAAIAVISSMPSSFDVRSVTYSFNGMWVVDNYSRFFKLIFLLGTLLTILISIKYLENEAMEHGEYYALILFATLGMMIMASGAELITIFLGIELMSMSLYVLAGYTRTRMISNESALKYFLLGSFATGFLLYGIALVYGSTGTTDIRAISKFIVSGGLHGHLITMGMALLVIGFGFKTA